MSGGRGGFVKKLPGSSVVIVCGHGDANPIRIELTDDERSRSVDLERRIVRKWGTRFDAALRADAA